MTLRQGFSVCTLCLIFSSALFGCSEKKVSKLDMDDIRFAGFYSDYLLQSGIPAGDDVIVSALLDPAQLDTLLVRHTLSRERFTFKTQTYSRNPDLWRLVLLQVRENIRKKTDSAQ
ncbi:hypothetical protein [Chlorobium sp. KB01]|uniref:hypothetical protein n=1 Tax=Chlorobium sp. KB01 TaxID=1917528 RepID=UPI00097716A1|nr:hypothetical protein [Chlorobium sp. KB01]